MVEFVGKSPIYLVQFETHIFQCPVFLLFLDCVQQLLHQFPCDFEFSPYYLISLWDLALAGCCKTFLFSSIRESMDKRYSREKIRRLRHAWFPQAFFHADFLKLCRNPLFAFRHSLQPACRQQQRDGLMKGETFLMIFLDFL